MQKLKPIFAFFNQHTIFLSRLFLLILVTASSWVFWKESTPPKELGCEIGSENFLQNESDTGSSLLVPFLPIQGIGLNHNKPVDLASRPGFSLSASANANFWSQQLHAAWYLDWNVRLNRNFNQPEHWQMVRLSAGCITPSLDFIRWVAIHYPGDVWIIGNEPDVAAQDAITPEEYASDYRVLYQLLKTTDTTAQIAVAGVAQGTPLRLAYLDQVLKAYQKSTGSPMPVDWWTLHGYVLREESGSWGVGIPPGFSEKQGQLYEIGDHGSLTLFAKQITAFRSWMKDRGYQNTPLALTEFGILLPADNGYSPEVVKQYLTDTFQWLAVTADPQNGMPQDNYHLVQRWAWFSLADTNYPVSDLADLKNMQLTPAGAAYRDFLFKSTH